MRIPRIFCATLPIFLAFTLSGCFIARNTNNEPLNAERLNGLKPGVTTAQEVVDLFGAPTDVVQLGRRSAYRFDFTVTKRAGLFLIVLGLFNDDTRSDRLWVFFDENQVLSHVGATLNANDARYGMPWSTLYDE